MIEVALSESTEEKGLDFVKALSRHSSRIEFEDEESLFEFIEYLNGHSEDQRENITYQHQPMGNNRTVDQIQARSSD